MVHNTYDDSTTLGGAGKAHNFSGNQNSSGKMTEECIDLVTPEADRKPRARRIPLPSLAAAAATLSFDLTADTPSPVSARGIADNDNNRRGGDARNGSDRRPPDIPCHLPGMNEYARSNTSHALASVTAPVTNSSSSPRATTRKPRRRSLRSTPWASGSKTARTPKPSRRSPGS